MLDFSGGGNTTVNGTLGNTSNGSVLVTVNDGSTVTLQGATIKSNVGDAYRYLCRTGCLWRITTML